MGQLEARNQSRHKSSSMKIFYISLLLSLVASQSPDLQEPPAGQRCSGRNYNGRRCCTPEQPCGLGEGDCDGPLDGGTHDGHQGCKGDLMCGSNNCKKFGAYFHEKDDCCDRPENLPVREEPVFVPGAPFDPPAGQRCRGRNYDGKRCCTPENPCDEGEGDCDGPADGGQHDGHAGCKGDLVCGSNNCLQFGKFYHPKDDCCEKSKNSSTEQEVPFNPFENSVYPTFFRPIDKRCGGRNIDEGLCCSQETPCDLGEGDCESDNDCQGDLVCGNNNCKQFAAYYHKKDDCCVKPEISKAAITSIYEWGSWLSWSVNSEGERTRLRYQRPKQVVAETTTTTTELDPNIPFEPREGQRCAGRNYLGRRCCTPEQPCGEGEGDCDGPADGGQHDGHAGCEGDLVCGSNNCKL